MASATTVECLICEIPLNEKDDVVITECQHQFHRACAQERLLKKNRSDCYHCSNDSALGKALNEHPMITTTTHKPTQEDSQSDTRINTTILRVRVSTIRDPNSNLTEDQHVPPSSNSTIDNDQVFHSTIEEDNIDILSDSSSVPPPDKQHKEAIVYLYDLPFIDKTDIQLAELIHIRITQILKITPIETQCYSKLGVGYVRVENNQAKESLLIIGNIPLNPKDKKTLISFSDTLELVSYIVFDVTKEKNNVDFPQAEKIMAYWAKLCKGERPCSCEAVNIQFPNIYRIISTSLNDLLNVPTDSSCLIEHQTAQIYVCSYCSYFEDLPKSISENELREALCRATNLPNKQPSSFHIQLNKKANNACIIASDEGRKWAIEKWIYLPEKAIPKKESLTCRLLLQFDPKVYTVDEIVNHQTFSRTEKSYQHRGNNLILEISDKKIFDDCIRIGVLRIGNKPPILIEAYNTLNDPEACDIDAKTWYEGEMLQHKSDIMLFVNDLKHKIFRYRWNPEAWIEQFQRSTSLQNNQTDSPDQHDAISSDERRHKLRMTVTLNTIGAIRKKKYRIGEREFDLHLNPNLKTIVYNHQSKLQPAGSIPTTTTASYQQTTVKVRKEDCLIAYEHLVGKGKRPVLLNMANQTSAGGGYQRGDGAQEENLFRRSDYFRSLDKDLDRVIKNITSERWYCTSTGDLDSNNFDSREMYPMDDYGAIYTSGLTVFRQSEDTGYAFMEKPLTNVCAIAMAAYREPKLDGNQLSNKYAVGMRKKIENIFAIAHHHNHDCLILSAFGCGAFRNPPDHVAKIFQSVIEQYAGFFELIVFAIIDDHNTGHSLNPQGNFLPFQRLLDQSIVKGTIPSYQPNTMFGPYRFIGDGLSVADVFICDLLPCPFGAHCKNMYSPDHAKEYSHPPWCVQDCGISACKKLDDSIHMYSFIHQTPCPYGGLCKNIDDNPHALEFKHPSFCPAGGDCQDMSEDHEKAYCHLPLCPNYRQCADFQRRDQRHCDAFRHCTPHCEHGNNCGNIHDKNHIEKYQHPFRTPCPRTPYHCPLDDEFTQAEDKNKVSNAVYQHYREFAHVCRFGRNCREEKNPSHLENTIHILRPICPYADRCKKLTQEDHLNSWTHPNVRDIRHLCRHGERCRDRQKPEHLQIYWHPTSFADSGVVRFHYLNEDINFVRNQNSNIERIQNYLRNEKWTLFSSDIALRQIIDWLRIAKPVHRCKPNIFHSILVHGHVMSREYMDQLAEPAFVAHIVLQHGRIQRTEALKIRNYAEKAMEYVTALIENEYADKFTAEDPSSNLANPFTRSSEKSLESKENYLLSININRKDLDEMKRKAIEIAQASWQLKSKKTGFGHPPDVHLGTVHNVFSILGPNLGKHYGDIYIIFKREILHHPDSNFSIQAATSYHSGRAFELRPWLGKDPVARDKRVELFHSSKLHASIPGYEYAAALEIMAFAGLEEKTMDVDLTKIFDHWKKIDSHKAIEVHLPKLIPLDYIDHIYMAQETYNSYNRNTQQLIKTFFDQRITITPHQLGKEYSHFVTDKLCSYIHTISTPIQGAAITVQPTNFNEHIVLPLKISQAYEQYCIDHPGQPNTMLTTYIYWQVMNGDMMLSLSNKRIEHGANISNIHCLVCYLASKPSINDADYQEQASYLNNGVPFIHDLLMRDGTHAVKSTTFYRGCNTNDFLTFCLEIQYSTGTVTLFHAGPNSSYNQKKISHSFARSNLDLTKLDFIHVSAGAHTVPIRNLIVTFQSPIDPLEYMDIHIEQSLFNNFSKYRNAIIECCTKLPDVWTRIDQSTTAQNQTVPKPRSKTRRTKSKPSTPNIESLLTSQADAQLQLTWLLISLVGLFLISTINNHYGIMHVFNWILYPISYILQGILNFPTIIPVIIRNMFVFLWTLISYVIRYEWFILSIIISEIVLDSGRFPNWKRKLQSIEDEIELWHRHDPFRKGSILGGILLGPFLLKVLFYCIVFVLKLVSILLWTLIVFAVRYEWALLLILISEMISKSYRLQPYESMKEKLQNWCRNDNLRIGILFVSVITGPFLLEKCLYYSIPWMTFLLIFFWKLIVLVIRYEWLILLLFVCEVIDENDQFPNFTNKYRSIVHPIKTWHEDNKFRIAVLCISVITGPFLLEKCLYFSMPWITFLLICLWKLILLVIRYGWLIVLLFISDVLVKTGDFPNFTTEYRALTNRIKIWHRDDDFRIFMLTISIIAGPFLFDQFLYYYMPTLIMIMLRFSLFAIVTIPLIVINDILTGRSHAPNYILRYKRIANSLVDSWQKHSHHLILGIVICLVIRGPFFIEFLLFNTLTVVKLIFICLWAFILFTLQYGWLALSIIIIEYFIDLNRFQDYAERYTSFKQELNNWQKNDHFRRAILIFLILAGPFLFEFFLFHVVWSICSITMMIIKYTFTVVVDF